MRLWHEALLPYLPRQQLLGQHRECCALRGKGWGKKHATVDYVFKHSYLKLYHYHMEVIKEMEKRGYQVEPLWLQPKYRGKNCSHLETDILSKERIGKVEKESNACVYPEHDPEYLQECLENLACKGINLSNKTIVKTQL
ncbi:TIGR02328 family protein [Desulfitobacterium metallireducens]|uniref:Pyrimidine dimer DNA glycosylase n=1 Tax=Desulfitobacterium metallireducens DSM 15288 TaxID=871968 RepID=W0EBE2_9FIRM|nr:TIGR02328 family protein [Desulfitobacterium metallireducens]AHF06848.1 pyrimidine dimer DNA glycosylase [Desulfitobacterium metallireducens DSM 15288]